MESLNNISTCKNSYRVQINRDNKNIAKTFKDLNEAIYFRDQVLDFYGKKGYFPEVEPSRELPKNIRSLRGTFEVKVTRENKTIAKTFKDLNEAIYFRDQVIDFYDENHFFPEVEPSRDLPKYVCLNSKRGFQVQIKRNDKTITKYFKDLNEAIYFRDQVLGFYDDYGVLPSGNEIELIKLTM
jgi:predicted ribosome-associated RNA-binding protein Tma20